VVAALRGPGRGGGRSDRRRTVATRRGRRHRGGERRGGRRRISGRAAPSCLAGRGKMPTPVGLESSGCVGGADTVCVGKAGISLSVKVRPGQSRADRPAASLAGVVVTRGPKRRQQVHGIYRSNPEMGLSRRPSWKPYQRRQYDRPRYARGWLLRRGLRVSQCGLISRCSCGWKSRRRDYPVGAVAIPDARRR
jgi:hypothetical protein